MASNEELPDFSVSLVTTTVSITLIPFSSNPGAQSAPVVFPVFPSVSTPATAYGTTSLSFHVFGQQNVTQSSPAPAIFRSMPLVAHSHPQVLGATISTQGTVASQTTTVGVSIPPFAVFSNPNLTMPFPFPSVPPHFSYQLFPNPSIPITPSTPPLMLCLIKTG
jgi:hypothetical protein